MRERRLGIVTTRARTIELVRLVVGIASLWALPALVFYSCFIVPLLLNADSQFERVRASAYLAEGTRTMEQFRRPPPVGGTEWHIPTLVDPLSRWLIFRIDVPFIVHAIEGHDLLSNIRAMLAAGMVWALLLGCLALAINRWNGWNARPSYVQDLVGLRMWSWVTTRAFSAAAWTTLVRSCLIAAVVGTIGTVVVPVWTHLRLTEAQLHGWLVWHSAIVIPGTFFVAYRRHFRVQTEAALTLSVQRCHTCSYRVARLHASVCPECGSLLPTAPSLFPKRLRELRNVRLAAMATVFVCSMILWTLVSDSPTLWIMRHVPKWTLHPHLRSSWIPRQAEANVLRVPAGTWCSFNGAPGNATVLLRVDRFPRRGVWNEPAWHEPRFLVRVVYVDHIAQWVNKEGQGSFPRTFDELMSADGVYASGGVVSVCGGTQLWVGRTPFTAMSDDGWVGTGMFLKMWTADWMRVSSFGRFDSRPTNEPLADVMDALDWSAFEKQPGLLEICPSPIPVRDMPRRK